MGEKHFMPGEEVNVDFKNSKVLKGVYIERVTISKRWPTLYDIKVPVGFDEECTIITGIPADFVTQA